MKNWKLFVVGLAMGFCVALTLGTGTFTGTRVIKADTAIGAQPQGAVGRFQAAYSGDTITPWIIDTATGKLYKMSGVLFNPDGTLVGGGQVGQMEWVDYSKKYKLPSLLIQ